jgi:hypothetical protein
MPPSILPRQSAKIEVLSETPNPFACKVFVYEGALRDGQYDPKLPVVLEDVGGQWKVSQWL